jgi:hypothetical protein
MRDEAVAGTASEKFVVRLPKGMRRAISDAARRNRRSMNSEIVAIIDRALGEVVMAGGPVPQAHAMSVSSTEQAIVLRLRSLPESKRRALLELLE